MLTPAHIIGKNLSTTPLAFAQNYTSTCSVGIDGTCYATGHDHGLNNPNSQCLPDNNMNSTQAADYCSGFNRAHIFLQSELGAQNNQLTGQGWKDLGDLSDLKNIPLVGPMLASHSVKTTILRNERGIFIPWSFACQKLQSYLIPSCDTLVQNGVLTHEGDRAIGCIRNGFAAAILANEYHISFDTIKSALSFAGPITGCGGIVNLDSIPNSPLLQNILGFAGGMIPGGGTNG
jgi:hypothetical protein